MNDFVHVSKANLLVRMKYVLFKIYEGVSFSSIQNRQALPFR